MTLREKSSPSSAERQAAAQEFETILSERGLHAALRFLNARTRHRFTGIYRFDRPTLRNICMYDRENPTLNIGADNPITETYCSILDETRAPFGVKNSATDARVAKHPGRERVISYCGVPLLNADGTAQGSLCHFDLRPRIIPTEEIPLMEAVARLLLPTVTAEARSH